MPSNAEKIKTKNEADRRQGVLEGGGGGGSHPRKRKVAKTEQMSIGRTSRWRERPRKCQKYRKQRRSG